MLGVALHYNDKAGRDRVVSHAMVDEMTRAGWIQKADDLPQGSVANTSSSAVRYATRMQSNRSALSRGRRFAEEIIVLCVLWYLRFSLSYRDLEELITERGLSVDPTTVWRWVQRYAPELDRRVRRELKRTGTSWRVDETYVRVAGHWMYLYRGLDSSGATLDFLSLGEAGFHGCPAIPQQGLGCGKPSSPTSHQCGR
jgi:hypothetical protein